MPDIAGSSQASSRRWVGASVILLFSAYFLVVTRDSWTATFAADDMLALYTYWHPSPWRLASSQVLLWRGYFRPMAGLYYMPIFWVRGLDPAPYHAALLLLLWIGAYQVYRFARALGACELAGAIAGLIACYHGGLANLYYNTVYVGDVLCGIFYSASFAHYARIRASGRLPKAGQTAAFAGLYLCALNSKEMALTLPTVLLAYEAIYYPKLWGKFRGKQWSAWMRGEGRMLCLSALLAAVSIYGKKFGPYGLMSNPAYRPVFSRARIIDFQERYLADIFYQPQRLTGWTTCAIWLAVTYFAWRRRRPILRFCWFYVLISPIPVEFIIGRDQANLYVTLAGWAAMAGALFMDWTRGAARVLSGEPLIGRLGEARLRNGVAAAGMIALAAWSWNYKETWIVSVIPKLAPVTAEVIGQFRALDPRVRPGAKLVFLDDPFPDGYDMEFIAELWFRDRTVRAHLNQKTPLPETEIAQADAVFTWADGKLVRVR